MGEERNYNTTVMFADMAGYTSKTSKLSRKELQDMLEEFEKVIKPAVKNFGGRIIKGMGDAFLITFHSPTNAVLCGIEIQKRIEDRNQNVESKDKFEARVGVSSGEVYERGGDIFGEPVNLASRVQSVAEGGQVVFSDSTFHAMNKNEFSIVPLGKKSLKGLSDKTSVYLAHEKGKKIKSSRIKFFFKNHWKKIAIVILALILISAITNNLPDKNMKNLDDFWMAEANAALEKNDVNSMRTLLDVYESAPEELKDFRRSVLAIRMFNTIGKRERAFGEIERVIGRSNIGELEELMMLAKEYNFPELRDRIRAEIEMIEGVEQKPQMS